MKNGSMPSLVFMLATGACRVQSRGEGDGHRGQRQAGIAGHQACTDRDAPTGGIAGTLLVVPSLQLADLDIATHHSSARTGADTCAVRAAPALGGD